MTALLIMEWVRPCVSHVCLGCNAVVEVFLIQSCWPDRGLRDPHLPYLIFLVRHRGRLLKAWLSLRHALIPSTNLVALNGTRAMVIVLRHEGICNKRL
jgi:hypothetical protein